MNQLRIGNQTSVWCSENLEPFRFAIANGFGAFEWFADKKWNADGTSFGWDETDMDADMRNWIRHAGRRHGIRLTVHAPWQANPLHAEGIDHLLQSVEFAHDIGAVLVNLHLYMDEGPAGYVASMLPVLRAAVKAGLQVSIENTPHTTPDDFNQTFEHFAQLEPTLAASVGMCLDIGHANLCRTTHNDYVAYMDALAPTLPLTHLHVHENHGDADSHLTMFTGPAATDDGGVRSFLKRLRRRRYTGVMILEQWPNPPELLATAATRLAELLGQVPPRARTCWARSLLCAASPAPAGLIVARDY